jgi:hypothetical protein
MIMKRRIVSATDPKFDIIERQLDNLPAYNCGYNLIVDPKADGNFQLVARENAEIMPKFKITPYPQDDGVIYYDVELEFPNIVCDENEYADHAEYCIHQWEKAARLATYIKQLDVDPNAEYED